MLGELALRHRPRADQVIDYTQENFTKNGNRYDLILDVVVNRSIDYKRAWSPEGTFVIGA